MDLRRVPSVLRLCLSGGCGCDSLGLQTLLFISRNKGKCDET